MALYITQQEFDVLDDWKAQAGKNPSEDRNRMVLLIHHVKELAKERDAQVKNLNKAIGEGTFAQIGGLGDTVITARPHGTRMLLELEPLLKVIGIFDDAYEAETWAKKHCSNRRIAIVPYESELNKK